MPSLQGALEHALRIYAILARNPSTLEHAQRIYKKSIFYYPWHGPCWWGSLRAVGMPTGVSPSHLPCWLCAGDLKALNGLWTAYGLIKIRERKKTVHLPKFQFWYSWNTGKFYGTTLNSVGRLMIWTQDDNVTKIPLITWYKHIIA